uniref:HECT-type E3 ubiquitin transferase n=1 Tax=Astyanax mexicanus TaxID=7994 RepID=A0A8B9HWV1_ASTMX
RIKKYIYIKNFSRSYMKTISSHPYCFAVVTVEILSGNKCVCVCLCVSCRLLQLYEDDGVNVAVPMRMLEVFSSEKIYLPVLQDSSAATALTEQILHYMVQKGYYRSLYVLVNHKLPSSLEYSDAPSVPLAHTLLEHLLKPLHFTYSSCPVGARQFVFSAFTEQFISPPFTEQVFHFFVPALADPRLSFPFHDFLWSLQATVASSSMAQAQAPWLFYFVLSVGEISLGSLSEEGLLLYLSTLQGLLPLLPVTESRSRMEINSDSEDEDDNAVRRPTPQDEGRISVQLITELCVQKLDTKQQTNALLALVWRDSASEDVFTMMASICHTLMVQHRMMVPKVRLLYSLAFNARFLRHLWHLITSMRTKMITGSLVPLLQLMSRGSPMSAEDSSRIIPLFYLFSSLFSHSLISIHDTEFFGDSLDGNRRLLTHIHRSIELIISTTFHHIWPLVCPDPFHFPKWTFALVTNGRAIDHIFQRLIYADKRDVQGDGPFLDGINVTIRRNYIYEDAYDKLSPENEPDLKKRIRVHLLNAHGLDEAGIDGGGIFREFLSELLKSGFNPNQGFFRTTNEGLLFPSPTAEMLIGESFTRHYYFLGRILGKVDLPVFILIIQTTFTSCAAGVLKHLSLKKPYRRISSEVFTQYNLVFSISSFFLWFFQVVELKPGGKDIPVTTANRIAYIHLVADYRLNKQIRAHCLAFRQGLANVVNLEWLRMFDQQEIQVLISGAHVPICLDDLKKFTNYSGGYSATHPVIKIFWDVVENFSDDEKRKLLKFVTSCSRPPLLGFKELYPAFCIHNGGNDLERLPTASTCMNLLKLPEFCDEQLMKSKLLYAIESSSGFELS